MAPVLEVSAISKRFGGIAAVDGVSFEVREGEILGIIGPNGCGKSTLFNCILGQLRPSAGEVKLDGRVTTGMRPCDLNRLGVEPHLPAAADVPEAFRARESHPRRARSTRAPCCRACSARATPDCAPPPTR